ncbi:MAG: rhomboid family intramembrane serine protease [Myxococcales bacterium]|nr:rhomboid family intramembrane serine protease [Myxococcales bacterium]
MFLFVPLGVEGGEVRFPVVGASILVGCVLLFFATWATEPNPLGMDPRSTGEAVSYLVEHPYLEVPKDFGKRFLPEAFQRQFAEVRSAWLVQNELPAEAVRAEEQAELERLALAALAAVKPTLFTKLALVKARGAGQVGWLTHMFLHFGWLHLLGNMLFLYAVALVLEDAWGRGLFLAFYLAGGLASALAEFNLHGDSAMVMAGASGAVFACIGAAMVRFARRRMRVGYVLFLGFLFRTGTFGVPLWVWGMFKAGGEVVDLALGATQGVAVIAHVAGFSFGALVALVMRGAGLDKQLVATDEVEDPYRPSVLPELEEAQGQLMRGQVAEARATLEAARRKYPEDPDIPWVLMGVDLQEGKKPQAAQQLERVLQPLLRAGHKELAAQRFTGAWPSFSAADFRPALAWQVVRTFSAEEVPRAALRELAKRAGSERSAVSARALLRAAELALEARDDDDAADCLEKVRAEGRLSRELGQRWEELSARVGPRRREQSSPGATEAVNEGPSAPPCGALEVELGAGLVDLKVAAQRQTFHASLTSARPGAVEVTLSSGATRALTLAELVGVGAGLVLSADGRKVLVLLLVVRAGDETTPAILVRLDSDSAGVERLRPGVSVPVAYVEFLRWVLAQSPAPAFPSREALEAGQFRLYADAAAMELAFFPR